MEIHGKIINALPLREGTSATGKPWQCASYVIETQEQYPRRVCFDVFGQEKIAQFNIRPGEMMTISFDIDAHEYNGRWFNSIRCWNVMRTQPGNGTVLQTPSQMAPQQPATPPMSSGQDGQAASQGNDGLPF